MGQRQTNSPDGLIWLVILIPTLIFRGGYWFFKFSKRTADYVFRPRTSDDTYEYAFKLRALRSSIGIGTAIVVYVFWRWGQDFGTPIFESILVGPLFGVLKLTLCCVVAMLTLIAIAKNGYRLATLRSMWIPFLIILSILGLTALITRFGSQLLPLSHDWSRTNTFVFVISLILQAAMFAAFLIGWVGGLPSSHEHCFRARDSHLSLAATTFIYYSLFLAIEGAQRLIQEGHPKDLPVAVSLCLLFGGPLFMLAISICELILLHKDGAELRVPA